MMFSTLAVYSVLLLLNEGIRVIPLPRLRFRRLLSEDRVARSRYTVMLYDSLPEPFSGVTVNLISVLEPLPLRSIFPGSDALIVPDTTYLNDRSNVSCRGN